MSYEVDDQEVRQSYPIGTGSTLTVRASEVRRERTGVHARLAVYLNQRLLAWSNFNVERDEDRVRLANSALRVMEETGLEVDHAYCKPRLKTWLDVFSSGVWAARLQMQAGGLLEGVEDVPPAQRLLGDFIVRGGGTILFGAPGSGKSNIALAMAVSLAWGSSRVWRVRDAAWPLYVNVERSRESMAARLARVNRALGLEPRTPLPFLNARGRSLADLHDAIVETAKREQAEVIFFDSLSRAGLGSLTQDDVANRAMDMLNAVGKTWLAIAHAPRQDGGHAFGSVMFDAAADLIVRATSQRKDYSLGVLLEVLKANDLPAGRSALLALEFNEEGLRVIRKSEDAEFPELAGSREVTKEELIRDYLGSVGHAAAPDIATALAINRVTVWRILKAAPWARAENTNKSTVYFYQGG